MTSARRRPAEESALDVVVTAFGWLALGGALAGAGAVWLFESFLETDGRTIDDVIGQVLIVIGLFGVAFIASLGCVVSGLARIVMHGPRMPLRTAVPLALTSLALAAAYAQEALQA